MTDLDILFEWINALMQPLLPVLILNIIIVFTISIFMRIAQATEEIEKTKNQKNQSSTVPDWHEDNLRENYQHLAIHDAPQSDLSDFDRRLGLDSNNPIKKA